MARTLTNNQLWNKGDVDFFDFFVFAKAKTLFNQSVGFRPSPE